MSASYTRELLVDAVGGTPVVAVLPAPTRGNLERLIIKQVEGAAAAANFTVYNRRGACATEYDLHVKGGGISASANNGGQAQFTTDAAHNLLPGDLVYIKGTGEATYDALYHTVDTVESSTVFTTTTAHASVVSAGIWQTPPLDEYPILDPVMHKIYEGSVTSGTAFEGFDLDRDYENRDNQDLTARRRGQALYLYLDPAGSGAQKWSVAISTISDIVGV
jgi:hypothetical protein